MSKPIDFKSLTGGKNESIKENEDAINELTQSLPMILEMMKIRAKVLKQYQEHLLAEGFSESEALEIVKTDKTLG